MVWAAYPAVRYKLFQFGCSALAFQRLLASPLFSQVLQTQIFKRLFAAIRAARVVTERRVRF
jgi:hypothetical protein